MQRWARSPYASLVILMTTWLSGVACWTAGYAAAPLPMSVSLGFPAHPIGRTADISVSVNADGQTDLAVWRPAEGNWYVLHSSTGMATITLWGQPGDIPVPGAFIR